MTDSELEMDIRAISIAALRQAAHGMGWLMADPTRARLHFDVAKVFAAAATEARRLTSEPTTPAPDKEPRK